LQIRSSLAPQTLAQSMIREITAVDSNLSVGEVITMREQVERTMAPQRVALLMIAIFASLALVLATIGLYGVMAYTVSQGRREFGLRMALGASPSDLLRLVMRYGLALTAVGMAVGLAVSMSSARLLGYLLYHVSPRDPAAFAVALAAMVIAAVAATVVPAWRASRTDPQEALRV
jgi:ABC-type antimicrobial peptide transport system permease subunit